MYYLSLLKLEEFNPEIHLREKLFWDWKAKILIKNKDCISCTWVYGISIEEIKEKFDNMKSKTERIQDYLNNKFEHLKETNIYIAKESFTEDIVNEFKGISDSNLLERVMKAAFGVQFKLDFINKKK